MKRIGRYFLQGLLVVAPLGVTAYVVYVVFKFIDGLLSEWIYSFLQVRIPGLGLITIFLLITLLGFITQSILFRPIKKLMAGILERFPS